MAIVTDINFAGTSAAKNTNAAGNPAVASTSPWASTVVVTNPNAQVIWVRTDGGVASIAGTNCIAVPASTSNFVVQNLQALPQQNSTPNNATGVHLPNVVPIVLGATTVATASVNPFKTSITISGGTVTVITVNGNVTGQTSGTFTVNAFGTVAVTYTGAPTTFSTSLFAGSIPPEDAVPGWTPQLGYVGTAGLYPTAPCFASVIPTSSLTGDIYIEFQ